jgi:hypothetical protein
VNSFTHFAEARRQGGRREVEFLAPGFRERFFFKVECRHTQEESAAIAEN